MIGVFVLSFMNWDGLGSLSFAGTSNWSRMLGNATTQHAIVLTLIMTVMCWVIQTPISLLLGVFMAGQQRYRAVLAVLYFLPLLFSATAVGIAFTALLDPNFGMSRAFGLEFLSQDFLGNPRLALPTIMVVIAWCFVPFHSLLYQGAARQIPASIYEAAMIDGAGRVQNFFYITLPQLRNTIITSSTLMITGSLTYFDLIFVMTAGGPGNATRVLPLDMYLTGFRSYNMGGASVIGVILVVVGLLIAWLLNHVSGSSKMESDMEGAV
ncbi:carbohydrate ABC transporter permease [Actinomyces ruminis]|uniref:carbohydrate ABC transporter permease n=1 Tax=Actinomyces ruminis TaxID=1937003 RepID=UPI00211F3F58|nr:sugar ABC transporter permease [Actinomyces ruminis]